jgi:beta-phosphoglucomutase
VIKACIFDLDGVIVDTAKYHFLAWKRLADELKIPFNESDNERLKGVSRMKSLEIILEIGNLNLDEEEKEKLADKKNSWYVEYINKMKKEEILPGVENFLDTLRKRGIKLAVASASKNTRIILERLKLNDFFDTVVDGNMVSKAKPDPEIFIKAAMILDIAPEEAVVFEDAVAGIAAAKKAGMKVVGVGNREILKDADIVIPDFQNINITLFNNF